MVGGSEVAEGGRNARVERRGEGKAKLVLGFSWFWLECCERCWKALGVGMNEANCFQGGRERESNLVE